MNPEALYVYVDFDLILFRLYLRPTAEDSDLFNFGLICFEGKDYSNILSSKESLAKALHEASGLSENDVEFGDVPWVTNYSPQVRMVDRFQVGRALVAGGQWFYFSFKIHNS